MSASRASRIIFLGVFCLTLFAGLAPASAAAAEPKPASMAATGDSITRAFNLCFFPFSDCPARSWSTGSNSTVKSHAYRLEITGSAYNDAVSGAKMADLPGQATTVSGRNVDYVTVLMGGNDVCTDTESAMTDPASYEADFRTAMNTLAADTTPPLVYVVSIPNVKMLWEILKDNSSARSAWNSYNICQSLLANPLSTDQADVDRRERVKQRNMAFNQALRVACADYAFCRFDGEAGFGTAFVPNDVSTRDYFHPSTAGQTKLASVSYDHGYWGTKGVNDAPLAAFTPACNGLTCTFTDTSSDPQGVTAWSWNLGDGRTSVAQHPSHTFTAGGSYTVTMYAIDALGATARVSHTVTVSDTGGGSGTGTLAGTVTDVSTSAAIGGATVTIDGTTLSATTDGSGKYTISVPVGSYTVTASATGYAIQQKPATISKDVATTLDFELTASSSATVTMHVQDLAGSSANVNRNHWRATVTITVFDSTGVAVEGATVDGSFSVGSAKSCITGSTGTCSVTSDNLSRRSVASVTFTVTGMTHASLAYESSDNLETSIEILRPA
ncbi:MAG TPA: carboxypeptidase regulatory-like domain-containing protein [Candidatus Binatia bacterium]|nr:carboxypeptidase regulatory-like domain-containing protein [Candidatus Binatia bacterium]